MPMSSLIPLMSVAAGGAIGASARYSLSFLLGSTGKFPWAVLCANVSGCFLAGIIGTWFLLKSPVSSNVQLLVVTGILGGFTTFSTFSLETLRLAEAGHWSFAALNVVLNVLGSLLAVFGGWWLARTLIFT